MRAITRGSGGNGNGVYLANAGCDNATIRDNRILDNDGPGIHFNGDSSVGGDGLQSGNRIERNLVAGNGQNGFNMDGVQSSIVINNVFAGNSRHGMRGFQIDAAEGPRDLVIINNTFAENGGSGVKLTEDSGGHVLFNNLMAANSEGAFIIEETVPQTSSNLDAASVSGLFVSPGTRDYRLAQSSSAIDAGVSSFAGESAPSDDLTGATRSGVVDAGAYDESASP